MAGRSDRNSRYPRYLKRMNALMGGNDPAQERVIRKLFIEAHAKEVAFKQKAVSRSDIQDSTEE